MDLLSAAKPSHFPCNFKEISYGTESGVKNCVPIGVLSVRCNLKSLQNNLKLFTKLFLQIVHITFKKYANVQYYIQFNSI